MNRHTNTFDICTNLWTWYMRDTFTIWRVPRWVSFCAKRSDSSWAGRWTCCCCCWWWWTDNTNSKSVRSIVWLIIRSSNSNLSITKWERRSACNSCSYWRAGITIVCCRSCKCYNGRCRLSRICHDSNCVRKILPINLGDRRWCVSNNSF